MKNSIKFIEKYKNKMIKRKTESRNVFGELSKLDNRLNNSMQKRASRNYKLKETDNNDKINVTDTNLENKSVDNIYEEEIQKDIINNHKTLTKTKTNTYKKEKIQKDKKQNSNKK